MRISWCHLYLLSAAAAFGISAISTQLFRNWALRRNLLDRPQNEAHKQHAQPVPVLGGPGMFLAWLAVLGGGILLLTLAPADWLPQAVRPHLPGLKSHLSTFGWILTGSVVLLVMGLVDDRRPLRAGPKFLIQALAAAPLVILGGSRLTFFCDNALVNIAATLFWYMLVINAINFFDNMDALAGGTAAIATAAFALIAGLHGQYFVATFGAVLCGSVLGFLIYNRPPASIFMGDAGSHFLGFNLATLGVMTNFFMAGESQTLAPIFIPLLVLAVPLSDVAVVFYVRAREGRPLYIGDNSHISHRFTRLGFSRAFSVMLIHLLNTAVALGAITLLWLPPAGVAVALVQIATVLGAIYLIQLYGWHRDRRAAKPKEP